MQSEETRGGRGEDGRRAGIKDGQSEKRGDFSRLFRKTTCAKKCGGGRQKKRK